MDRSIAERRFVPTLALAYQKEPRAAETGHRRSVQARRRLVTVTLILFDVLLALAVWEAAHVLQGIWGRGLISGFAVATILPTVAVWIGLRALLGLYPGYGLDRVEELRRQTYAVLATAAITALFAVALQVGDLLSRLQLVTGFLGLLFFAPLLQHLAKRWMSKAGLWGKPVIIFGSREIGDRFTRLLGEEWELGYEPVAVFDYSLAPAEGPFEPMLYEETLGGVAALARKQEVDTVIFAMPHTRREQLADLVGWASAHFRHVMVIPNLSGVTNSAVVARDLAGTFAVEIKHNLLDTWAQRIKRALDLFGAAVGGLLISPLLLAVAVLIKLDSPGPVMFVQERPGLNGGMFKIFKFRTMYTNAEQRLAELSLENSLFREQLEKHGKLKDDPRVTRVGRWLRKFSLDELPQLWNVLQGEMSLVGPRPYLTNQRSQIGDTEKFILRVLPGISGFWQVSGRSDATFEQRVGLDVYYVRNWSVWLDLVILARTVKSVVFGRGAY